MHIFVLTTVKLRGGTLFCFTVPKPGHTEVVGTTHYSREKQSAVTPRKSTHPLPWSLALTVFTVGSSCQHMVTLTSMFSSYSSDIMTPGTPLQGDPATYCSSLLRFLFHHFKATEMGQNNQTTAHSKTKQVLL